MKLVPFDKEKWQQGWKPYIGYGDEVKGLRDDSEYNSDFPWVGYVNGELHVWLRSAASSAPNSKQNLMLAEPEPEREREYWYRCSEDFLIKGGVPRVFNAIACIREKRPDGTWRALSSEEMAEVLK